MTRPKTSSQASDPSSEADLLTAEALLDAMGQRPLSFLRPEDLQAQAGLDESGLKALIRRHRHLDVPAFLDRHRVEIRRRSLRGETLGPTSGDLGWDCKAAADDACLRHLGMTPQDYAAMKGRRQFHMALPASFRRESVLTYLGRDPQSLYEQVEGNTFRFALDSREGPITVEATLGDGSVHGRLRGNGDDPDAIYIAHERLRRYLALAIDPAPFEARATDDTLHRRLIGDRQGLSIPQTPTLFDGLIWVIAGQQVSLPVAFSLRRRLGLLCATPVEGRLTEPPLFVPPKAEAVAALDVETLRKHSWSQRKSEYLTDLARDIAGGQLDLDALRSGSAVRLESTLVARRGLGPWSVNYLMMRCFGLADCVPVGDAGLKRGLLHFYDLEQRPSPTSTLELMQPFAPFRSLATFQLWARDAKG